MATGELENRVCTLWTMPHALIHPNIFERSHTISLFIAPHPHPWESMRTCSLPCAQRPPVASFLALGLAALCSWPACYHLPTTRPPSLAACAPSPPAPSPLCDLWRSHDAHCPQNSWASLASGSSKVSWNVGSFNMVPKSTQQRDAITTIPNEDRSTIAKARPLDVLFSGLGKPDSFARRRIPIYIFMLDRRNKENGIKVIYIYIPQKHSGIGELVASTSRQRSCVSFLEDHVFSTECGRTMFIL